MMHVLDTRQRYLDPIAICKARHNRPSTWEDDNDAFKDCQMPKEIVEERIKLHKEAMMRVVSYISKMIRE